MAVSTRTELIRVFGTRPPVITRDGGTVFVSVHDAEFLRARLAWKRQAVLAHPDRGGTTAAFRAAWQGYRRWLRNEAKWYVSHGIMPPSTIAGIGRCMCGTPFFMDRRHCEAKCQYERRRLTGARSSGSAAT